MKLTSIFLVAATLQVAARTEAQQVTISGKNLTLKSVFKTINTQTGFVAIYEERLLDKASLVTLNETDADLRTVLDKCFNNQLLTYTIRDKSIIIKEKEAKQMVALTEGLNPRLESPPPPTDVTIVVTDADGKPLEGASVTVKGSSKGLVTDVNGRVTFRAIDDNTMLVVSFTGYVSQEVRVGKRNSIGIRLAVSTSELDEMQVIAYGKVSKRFNLGNVTTVKGDEIEKQPVANVLQALQNRVPGMIITQANGLPNGGITVRIQGQNSIQNGTDPLYVIDGVPFYSQLPSTGIDGILGNSGGLTKGTITGSSNPLSFLNPSDIESVEILKDASATAIYGSRAANGAILITTKKGKAGTVRLNFNAQAGFGKVPNSLSLLNTSQYLQMRREAFRNDGLIPSASSTATAPFAYAPDLMLWDTARYTDWQKELIGGNAGFSNISASLSGGADNLNYTIGGTYNQQGSVFPGNYSDKKTSAHIALGGSSLNKKFNFQFSGNYMADKNKLPAGDLTSYIMLAPNAPAPYNADGTLNWAPNLVGSYTWDNPYKFLTGSYNNSTSNLITNLVLGYQILPGVTLRTSFGYTSTSTNDQRKYPIVMFATELQTPSLRRASYGNRTLTSWIIEPQLNFQKRAGQHYFETLLGATIHQSNTFNSLVNATSFSSDLLMDNLASAGSVTASSTTVAMQRYDAIFGRVNYRYRDAYLAEIDARRDGSSRFGPERQFHNFWSIGGGWIFSESLKMGGGSNGLSFGKLSASYGTTGSDQIGDYAYLNLYNSSGTVVAPYQGTTGLTPGGLVNPFLSWEETKKISVGLDVGFFRNELLLSVNYSRNTSSNQLVTYNLPSFVGASTVYLNLPATVQNTTWEMRLSSTNIRSSKLTWATNINLTIPKNILAEFNDLPFTSLSSQYFVGQPLSFIRISHFLGINPQTGNYMVADRFGNATFNPVNADRNIIRATSPTFSGGLGNIFKFDNLQLDIFISFVQKYTANNKFGFNFIAPGYFDILNGNQLTDVLSRWQKPGDVATMQKYTTGILSGIANSSDAGYSNSFFARLQNVSLSYSLPVSVTRKLHVPECIFYIQGHNLLTLTKFDGLDPETVTIGALPPLRVFTFGIKAKL